MQNGKTVTTGLVLRVTETKEADKILTVLTPDMGKIPLIARGARRKNSRIAAASQLLAYSELTLYKRGNWHMNGVQSSSSESAAVPRWTPPKR